jgi:hypothetical protein
MDWEQKYLKYKIKYLDLLKHGGAPGRCKKGVEAEEPVVKHKERGKGEGKGEGKGKGKDDGKSEGKGKNEGESEDEGEGKVKKLTKIYINYNGLDQLYDIDFKLQKDHKDTTKPPQNRYASDFLNYIINKLRRKNSNLPDPIEYVDGKPKDLKILEERHEYVLYKKDVDTSNFNNVITFKDFRWLISFNINDNDILVLQKNQELVKSTIDKMRKTSSNKFICKDLECDVES